MNINFWKNKNILITGHTGFKGSWLLIWMLKNGANVWGYALKAEELSLFNEVRGSLNGKFSHFEGDILDSKKLTEFVKESNPDIIFHLAAQPLVRKSYLEPIKTWETNVIGSLNILEATKSLKKKCAVIMVTTDKVYENKEWSFGYRENDALGGVDPYSASKACCEIAIKSWRESFCGDKSFQLSNVFVSTARSGNVIGGGDWSEDRLIPDAINALKMKNKIVIRNPKSKRPWQHVLEPLNGYILLAEKLYQNPKKFAQAFNFGPEVQSNKSVEEVISCLLKYWQGEWVFDKQNESFYEAELLHLQSEKSKIFLGWEPVWNFEKTIKETINWYKKFYLGEDCFELCIQNINQFQR